MLAWSQIYDFDKSVMPNVLYDTLEALDLHIDKADSNRGEIAVSVVHSGMKPLRFRLSVQRVSRADESKTEITASSDQDHPEGGEWLKALQDEIAGTLHRSKLLQT